MADAVDPIRENMHEEAPDELEGRQTHDLHTVPTLDPVVFPAECHGISISTDEAMV